MKESKIVKLDKLVEPKLVDADGQHRVRAHVEFGYRYLAGNSDAYFTITGKIMRRNSCLTCGCIGEKLLSVWPELEIFVRLHLHDYETALPMHAHANGKYFLENRNVAAIASHFWVTPEYATAICAAIDRGDKTPASATAELFVQARQKWEAGKVKALALLDTFAA